MYSAAFEEDGSQSAGPLPRDANSLFVLLLFDPVSTDGGTQKSYLCLVAETYLKI